MRPLRYSINVTLDGCCDHRAIRPDEEMHRHAAEGIERADVVLLGRITYAMMEEAWRPVAETGSRPDWMPPWMEGFAQVIHAARKVVVSDTLQSADWNAELVRGAELEAAVRRLKAGPGRGLAVGGLRLPLALAGMGLIDELELVVHPRVAGHGPRLLDGLPQAMELRLLGRREFASGALALRYEVGVPGAPGFPLSPSALERHA